MKKSSFVAMVMGTVGIIVFSIGLCMCLIPEWNAFVPGLITGSIGIAVILALIIVWRRMEGKTPIRLNAKTVGTLLSGTTGALLFGLGMSFTMIWDNRILGIIIGVAGIVFLLILIPLIKGLDKTEVIL